MEQYLKSLFGEAWGKRSEFIESARSGALTPSGLRKNLGRETDVTMPGNTRENLAHNPNKGSSGLFAAGIAGAVVVLLALIGVVYWTQNRQQTAVVVELPQNPQQAEATSAVKVETEPPGAQVTVDSVQRGPAPINVPGLRSGEHEVTASLAGRQSITRKVMINGPGERVQMMLTLPELPKTTRPPPDSTRAPVAGKGKLTLQTTPWTEVFLGGKSLGESPLIEVPLPAGKHTLRLVNAEANIKMSVEVEIAAGKTTVKKLKF